MLPEPKERAVDVAAASEEPQHHSDNMSTIQKEKLDNSDVDVGAQLVAGTVVEFDQAVMRRALWKIDVWVLPLLALVLQLTN